MKIQLPERYKLGNGDHNSVIAIITHAEPFVRNTRAYLIHRPRTITIRKLGNRRFISIKYLCGQIVGGEVTPEGKLTFIGAPEDSELVCYMCEARAAKMNLPTSSELAGKHVCVGTTRAHNICPTHGDKS